MVWRSILLGLFLLGTSRSLLAVANISNGTATPTYNTTAPTGTSNPTIPDWQMGWTQPAVQPTGTTTYTTGWNYVGSVTADGGASAVYLGNGWFVTAAHVAGTGGSLNVTLNGTIYDYVANSAHTFTGTATQTVVTSSGTTTSTVVNPVDISLFQVSPAPNLPALPLRLGNPILDSSHVAIIGFGDGGAHTNETWGYDTMNNGVSEYVNLGGLPYWTNDFSTLNGSSAEYQLVGGDSGGAAFIYNSSTGKWELAGLNEGEFSSNGGGSVFVQINNSTFSTEYPNTPSSGDTTTYTGTTTYETQIGAIIQPPQTSDTPAMPPWALIVLGGVLGVVAVPQLLRALA